MQFNNSLHYAIDNSLCNLIMQFVCILKYTLNDVFTNDIIKLHNELSIA